MGSTNIDPSSSLESTAFTRKGTITINRSLTEKRKDYVQRISRKSTTAQPQPQPSSVYGTLHRTFKSPHFETFSATKEQPPKNDDTRSNNSSSLSSLSSSIEDDNNDHESTTPSTSDRIKKYNRLMEATIRHHVPPQTPLTSAEKKPTTPETSSAVATNINASQLLLFDHCLLIGYNSSTGQAYVKSAFPVRPAVPVPPNVEQLVFPSAQLVHNSRADAQEYTVILTDVHGGRVYGYCRRVLPESCDVCLPLAYCLISRSKASGFFSKILKEIEQRHGQPDVAFTYLLSALQRHRLPAPGKFLHISLPSMSPTRSAATKVFAAGAAATSATSSKSATAKRLSLEVNPRWLTDAQVAQATESAAVDSVAEQRNTKKTAIKSLVQEFEEKKQMQQQQSGSSPPLDLTLINRSLFARGATAANGTANKIDEILIKRPNDVRLESTELSDLYAGLGAELLCNVFASLLLERKVILYSRSITLLSACVMGLQTLLYPFQWQYTLVTLLPASLTEICQAPFPVLAGVLERPPTTAMGESAANGDVGGIEDGILVDLDAREMREQCGDEATILPSQLRRSLLVSLEMVDILDQGKMLSSVLIAEAFLRFFIELFAGQKAGDDFEVSIFPHCQLRSFWVQGAAPRFFSDQICFYCIIKC